MGKKSKYVSWFKGFYGNKKTSSTIRGYNKAGRKVIKRALDQRSHNSVFKEAKLFRNEPVKGMGPKFRKWELKVSKRLYAIAYAKKKFNKRRKTVKKGKKKRYDKKWKSLTSAQRREISGFDYEGHGKYTSRSRAERKAWLKRNV